jgi:hypothetical protein
VRCCRWKTAAILSGLFLVCEVAPAMAQGSVSDVLSFLLTNQAVPTGDFTKDSQSAAVTRDTITRLLQVELTTQPLSSSSGGFTYRFNPSLGTVERASNSFGPFYTERSLTAGRGRASLGVSLQYAEYTKLDSYTLNDGTFVTTASQFRDESQPFDVESLKMTLKTTTFSILGNVGLTDRIDIGVAVPVESLSLEGSRLNVYRGSQFLQASATAEATGVGDIAIRGKVRLFGDHGSGLAVVEEVRLPTGSKEDLLGSGEASYRTVVVGSVEPGIFAANFNAGYTVGGVADQFDYRLSASLAVSPHVTLIGELVGRRIDGIGAIAQERTPHPTIAGVDTLRLVTSGDSTDTNGLIGGVKWNVFKSWLVNGSVAVPVSGNGLRADWSGLLGLEVTF